MRVIREVRDGVEVRRPSIVRQAGTAAAAGVRWLRAGAPLADAATLDARRAICAACEHQEVTPLGPRCRQCGCYAAKLRLATERCPLGRWESTAGHPQHPRG